REPLGERATDEIARRLEREALLVIARAAPEESAWARLAGPPPADGEVVVRPVGRGAIATLGFHPSAARDADGAATAQLLQLLVEEARAPVAWLDWSGVLVL